MKIIGLTGGIASGKSTVSQMLRDEGLVVIDADVLAREVVKPGSFGLAALVQIFGQGVLKNSELNRTYLRDKLFAEPECRALVENVTHPLIQWRARREFKILKAARTKAVIYDAALIFEKNLMKQFDGIIVIHVPFDIQLKRLMARDKVDETVARQRLSAQLSLDQKAARADYRIDNSHSVEETRKQVRDLAKNILK